MILSLKNKKASVYVDSSTKQQVDSITLDNTSINIVNNKTFVSLFDTSKTISNFNVTVSSREFSIAYRDGLTDNFIETTSATDTELRLPDNNGYQIRKWNLLVFSDKEGSFETDMNVSYEIDGVPLSYTFKVSVNIIGIDSKLIVHTQNRKIDINDDYYQAFSDTDYKTSDIDQKLMNEKRKEYLLRYFELTAGIGSYDALLNALDYFGYGDLLTIREIWKNGERYTTTDVDKMVLDSIDKRLTGFRKTNQMQLVYKINDWDGTFDSDGLPNYVNVLLNTEEILIKMYALRRVLERDFLPLNTKIVDIIGEQKGTVGIDARIWDNVQTFFDVNINEHSDGGFDFNLSQSVIEISEHEVLRKVPLLKVINPNDSNYTGEYQAGVTDTKFDYKYFEIDKVLNYEVDELDDVNFHLDDLDYLEKYLRNDFGLVEINIDADTSKYSRFKFEIIKDDVSVYTSSLYEIDELVDNSIKFGIAELGKFKIMVYLFDYYGGVTLMNPNNQEFEIVLGNIDFKLAKLDRSETSDLKGLDFWSTFETYKDDNRTIQIDIFDDTYDINTWQESTNSNLIFRYNAKDYDKRTLQLNSFQYNSLKISDLIHTRLTDYGYEYARFMVDLIGDGTTGDRTILIKEFEHHDWIEVTVHYDSAIYDEDYKFYNDVVSAINESSGLLDNFTATIQSYSETDILSSKLMLRLTGKNVGFGINHFILETNASDYNTTLEHKEDIYTVMPFSSYVNIYPDLTKGANDLYINGSVVSNFDVTNTSDLKTELETQYENLGIRVSVFDLGNHLIVSSLEEINIKHESFGYVKDSPRGVEGSRLKEAPTGDIVSLGVPFYAFIDTKTLIDGADYLWTLKDALTGEILDTQSSLVYRNMLIYKGSYTLELDVETKFGSVKRIKNGFVIVD
ncbi:hypothetical protein BPT24_246 [Tenacibaculum phage pT24]|uniref:Uncharacterized protein n=1 Tax=Tenacibaculum phage pT24 TaxID=1880590 RepID=A0A1B4XX23_9CAUD|nr:hypothetical protein HYP10_gp282 [Tenacibaculum phage pT24]BAV39366.1 hypothetical protein BPT24_246 [Tenacibaculum phage pT24]